MGDVVAATMPAPGVLVMQFAWHGQPSSTWIYTVGEDGKTLTGDRGILQERRHSGHAHRLLLARQLTVDAQPVGARHRCTRTAELPGAKCNQRVSCPTTFLIHSTVDRIMSTLKCPS